MIEEATAEHPQMPITELCELLSVSRSWYYERPSAEASANKELDLRDAIEGIVLEFPGYGYRRVTAELHRRGWSVNRKRVLRIMRQESLLCQLRRRFVPTTHSRHAFGIYPNLIKDAELDGINQAWIADITYVRLPAAFCYLAAILDAYSRRCIGWCLSRRIDTSLTLAALEMALANRLPEPGLIHHADRGVQYACGEYLTRLEQAGIRPSMAAVANPYENAKAESFFRTLKMEEVYIKDYRDFFEAEENLGAFIEEVYNEKRLHSSLGYLPPIEFEANYATGARS